MGVKRMGESRERSAEPSAIRVDIGELVLDGFQIADADRVSASFERELTRLIREQGVPAPTSWSAETLSGLPPLPANLSARRLGQELARAVHAGLSGTASSRGITPGPPAEKQAGRDARRGHREANPANGEVTR